MKLLKKFGDFKRSRAKQEVETRQGVHFNTVNKLSTRFWEMNPTNSVVIPQGLVLGSIIALGCILIYRNCSIRSSLTAMISDVSEGKLLAAQQ